MILQRIGKILLIILSFGPIAWTMAILIAAKFDIISIEEFFVHIAYLYIFFGGWLWGVLCLILLLTKSIKLKQIAILFAVAGLGILTGYLSLRYDIFHVSSVYID